MPIDRRRLVPMCRGLQSFWCVCGVALGRPRGLSTLTVFGMEGISGALISGSIVRERHAELASPLAVRQTLSISTARQAGGGLDVGRRA